MLAAVEQRFGTTQAAQPIEWLTDNGSAFIGHRTRSFTRELGLQPLTTSVGSPQSNAQAESFMKTLKVEEIYLAGYKTIADVTSRLPVFLEDVYNARRMHSSLGYLSPKQFEDRLAQQAA